MARNADRLQDGTGCDDQEAPVSHVGEPYEVAVEREDIVDEHDAEVGGGDDPVDDVPQGRTADLERQRLDVNHTGRPRLSYPSNSSNPEYQSNIEDHSLT